MTLYEITDEYRNALENIEVDENGEVLNLEELERLEGQLLDKTEAVGIFIKGIKTDAEAIANEERALKARREAKMRKAAWLTDYLMRMMLINEMPKFETAKVALSMRKSEAVIIEDESLIPKDYLVEKITVNPDKVGIKKAIKNGLTVPGAFLEERQNLQIK